MGEFLKQRGEEFLEVALELLKKEKYALSSFNFEQASQLFLKYYLYLKLGDYPKTLSDILLETQKKKKIYYENYVTYSAKIKEISKKYLGEAKVYLFGSIVSREVRPVGFLNPFEIHIITDREYEGWYKNFIKDEKILVTV